MFARNCKCSGADVATGTTDRDERAYRAMLAGTIAGVQGPRTQFK